MHKQRNSIALALTLAVGLGVSSSGVAQDNTVGEAAYAVACAVCHGSSGQGGGEFADILTIKPPDLTTISARNDGQFPYLKVFQIVDGRTTLRAHGTPVMPIWGDYFSREVEGNSGGYGSELLVRARIVALVDYIESLQM